MRLLIGIHGVGLGVRGVEMVTRLGGRGRSEDTNGDNDSPRHLQDFGPSC